MDFHEFQLKRFGEFSFDPQKRLLFRGEEQVALMPKAIDLLAYFLDNAGRLIKKDELMAAVWPDTIVEESNLSLNVSILRKALGERPAENRYIATIPGQGYKFVASVWEEQAGSENYVDAVPEISEEIAEAPPAGQKKNRSVRVLLAAALILITAAALWYLIGRDTNGEKIRTIAVLPFKPLDRGQRDETLELGMADTLISKLGESGELIVRPIGSVRRFDSIDQDALEAGRALGVEAVLEGSIQRAGEKIRMTVRMLRTADGRLLWSGTYDEQATDIFELQDTISRKAADALRVRLGGGRAPYTRDLEAYQLYMRGRLQVLKATRPELLAGIENFKKAIAIDPRYALAYAGMADAYRTLALGGEMRPLDVFPQAKASALKAVELDDSLAEAHMALASALFWCDWNWAESERHFKRALELGSHNADTYSEYAFLLSNIGRHDESLTMARRAIELDPLNLRTNARYGQFLNHAGRTDEALAILRRTLELDPEYWLAYQFAASTHLVRREYAEAARAADMAKQLNPESTRPIAYGGYARARLGDAAAARNALNELIEASKTRYIPNVNIAVLRLALGDENAAVDSLRLAAEEKDPWMTFLKVEPIWFELEGDPEFRKIRSSLRLE